MEQEQKPEKVWFLEAGYVVPLAIFITYFWALAHAAGFCDYFHIPFYFLSLNPTTVISITGGYYFLGAVIVLLPFLSYYLAKFLEYLFDKNPSHLFYVTLAVIFLLVLMGMYLTFNTERKLLWSIVGVFSVLVLIVLMWFRRNVIARQKRIREKRLANTLPSTPNWNFWAILTILIAVGAGYPIFYYFGKSGAKNARLFHVVKQSLGSPEASEVVILGNYGDYLYAVPIIRGSKPNEKTQFESNVVILKMPADDKRLTLTLENIGPLQPKPEVKP